MRLLIKNIGQIVGIDNLNRRRIAGSDMDHTETLANAWIATNDERIDSFGVMDRIPDQSAFDEVIDARGGVLMPSFCDSHTHIVYAGSREQEFLDKIHGLSYEEIARRGGGILN